jgi:hypothetical protein
MKVENSCPKSVLCNFVRPLGSLSTVLCNFVRPLGSLSIYMLGFSYNGMECNNKNTTQPSIQLRIWVLKRRVNHLIVVLISAESAGVLVYTVQYLEDGGLQREEADAAVEGVCVLHRHIRQRPRSALRLGRRRGRRRRGCRSRGALLLPADASTCRSRCSSGDDADGSCSLSLRFASSCLLRPMILRRSRILRSRRRHGWAGRWPSLSLSPTQAHSLHPCP